MQFASPAHPNLKQNTRFPITEWLSENDDLLRGEWIIIPRTYEYDPVRGYRQRYTRVPEREGVFRFRSISRPSQYRKNPDGTPKTLWRVEVRYLTTDELDRIHAEMAEWPE